MTTAEFEAVEVSLPLKAAQAGLPSICAMTGERADGAIPVPVGRSATRWRSPVVRIPLSEPVFKKWSRRENIHIKARGLASILTAVGVVIAFRNAALAIGVLAVAVAIHLLDLWAERGASESRPAIRRVGPDIVLSGVHERFATAVNETSPS